MPSKAAPRERELRLAELAARQHGVVSAAQLTAAGVDRGTITLRARAGRLHGIHRGVYAVGHRGLSMEGRWMAAVLACRKGAVLSHRSAAQLWRLLPIRPGPVEVTIPGGGGRRRLDGLRRHRSTTLGSESITHHSGIPVTTPARTIQDLRRSASLRGTDRSGSPRRSLTAAELRRAVREAEVLGLDIGIESGQDQTRSELEARFLNLCRRHRLSMPEVNATLGPFVVDFLWRARGLIVETDGFRYHSGRQAFEDDRARDVQLRMRGFDVVRFSYRQVTEDPGGVAQALVAILK